MAGKGTRVEGSGAPLIQEGIGVEPAWLDYNGHLNMAYYVVIFDRAMDGLVEAIGLSVEPTADHTIYAAETQVRYLAEVHAEATLRCETSVLRVDERRVHSWQVLRHADGTVAATSENLHLSIARGTPPRVAPFRADILARLKELCVEGPKPEGSGGRIAARMISAPTA